MCEYRFDIVDSGAWGVRLANGTWTGAFGALQREVRSFP